jgi:hypothetical protein
MRERVSSQLARERTVGESRLPPRLIEARV